MNNEEVFFNNLRQAITAGTAGPDPVPPCDLKSSSDQNLLNEISTRPATEQLELISIFQKNAQLLEMKTTVVASKQEATAAVIELIRAKDPEFSHNKHVIVHDHPELEFLELWKKLNREAVTVHTSFLADPQLKDKTVASFIGITAPDIGVAESATLVECGCAGRPRSTSLVPSIHIAIIKREQLVSNLEEAYALLKQKSHLDEVVFITGASKTADIEAQLVHGAHGPKEVHVIIISPPTPTEEVVQEIQL